MITEMRLGHRHVPEDWGAGEGDSESPGDRWAPWDALRGGVQGYE